MLEQELYNQIQQNFETVTNLLEEADHASLSNAKKILTDVRIICGYLAYCPSATQDKLVPVLIELQDLTIKVNLEWY